MMLRFLCLALLFLPWVHRASLATERPTAEGVRFTHAFAQPLCIPTRIQLMTGLSNHPNGTHQAVTSQMRDGRTIRGGKGLTLQTGIHVPLIVWQPGTIGPAVTDRLG